MMTLYTATITLILVMDPLGNIPIFISVLNPVEPSRRIRIILRESLIAFILLALFLFFGDNILDGFGISEPAFRIGGGIILFLIALKMIFPPEEIPNARQTTEPFIVPLAMPLIAGPSALTTALLLANEDSQRIGMSFFALVIAALFVTTILLFCNTLQRLLGHKVLTALERLMGMILTTVAVQMFLLGINGYFQLQPSV